MKKNIYSILLITFLSCLSLWAQNTAQPSEIDIYNELNIYANAKYYPGVIEQAELLEKKFPGSVFIVPARVEKANALIILNRYEQAEETLSKVLASIHFGDEVYARSWYYLGKAYYYGKDYISALNAFYTACDVENREEKKEYYHSSLFFSGRIYFFMELYDKAVPLFEYVVANGNYYSKPEYDESLQKLCFAYNSCGMYDKAISLYSKLEPQSFSEGVYSALTIYAADAYEKKGQVQKAYEVLNSNENQDFKEMLAAFRLNLGVAAYGKKDYDGALNYLKLAQETSSQDVLLNAYIYEQKIALDRGGAGAAEVVRQSLEENQAKFTQSQVPGALDSYNALMMRCVAFSGGDAAEVQAIYEKIAEPRPKDAYVVCTALSKKNAAQAEQIIAPFAKNTDCARLYASLLAKNGKYAAAAEQYGTLYKKNYLSNAEKIEYAKVLYRQKKWTEARDTAVSANHTVSAYIAGLCEFNLANYKTATDYLTRYVNSKPKNEQYKKTAQFYRGLSFYKIQSYKDSYSIFADYVKAYTVNDSYRYRAYEFAAKSALMNSDLKNAAVMARGMIDASSTVEQKQNAVIYCADIYSDCRDYDSAIKLLSAYTKDDSDFAVQCLLATAKVYEKKGELKNADSTYQSVMTKFPGTAAAEDAAYRCGEIYYSAQKYEEAETRFTKYIYSFVNGKYSDAAWYFSGDCNMKLLKYDNAIMQNNTLVSKYPDSIYSYGAYKNLLQAYYAQEDYRSALMTARTLVQKYNSQAQAEGMGQRIIELERIVGGDDRSIVEKNSEYERAGKTSTKKGRNAGSELVQLYAANGDSKQAFELASELLKYQKDADEMLNAAKNAEYVAGYYYNQGQNSLAAESYLKAAEYYRAGGSQDTDKAAGALYSAVDAFMAAGMTGDARVTANLLVELYPDTKQGKKVMDLLK